MSWAYDGRARRYRDTDTGRFMTQARATEMINASMTGTRSVTAELARLVAGGQMSPEDWRLRMREEIKSEIIRQYLAGRGGLSQMTPVDWGSVGGMIADQYRYLDGRAGSFAELVRNGELTEEAIAARAGMYINSAREGYERGLARRLAGSAYREEAWFTTSGESCDDCIDLANLGWVKVGTIKTRPGAGDTACLTNCQCYMSYRNPDNGMVFGVAE